MKPIQEYLVEPYEETDNNKQINEFLLTFVIGAAILGYGYAPVWKDLWGKSKKLGGGIANFWKRHMTAEGRAKKQAEKRQKELEKRQAKLNAIKDKLNKEEEIKKTEAEIKKLKEAEKLYKKTHPGFIKRSLKKMVGKSAVDDEDVKKYDKIKQEIEGGRSSRSKKSDDDSSESDDKPRAEKKKNKKDSEEIDLDNLNLEDVDLDNDDWDPKDDDPKISDDESSADMVSSLVGLYKQSKTDNLDDKKKLDYYSDLLVSSTFDENGDVIPISSRKEKLKSLLPKGTSMDDFEEIIKHSQETLSDPKALEKLNNSIDDLDVNEYEKTKSGVKKHAQEVWKKKKESGKISDDEDDLMDSMVSSVKSSKKDKEKRDKEGNIIKREEITDEKGRKIKVITHTGPRGGKWYKNSEGNKTYINDSLEDSLVSLSDYISCKFWL